MTKTIYTEVEIDIEEYLHEANTDVLIEELQERLSHGNTVLLKALGAESLQDVCKLESLLSKYKDIPESDIDEFIAKY